MPYTPVQAPANMQTFDELRKYVEEEFRRIQTSFAGTEQGLSGPSNTTPLVDGVGAPGTSKTYARGDHVHPMVGSTTIVGAIDLNTITAAGLYSCQTNTVTNGPYTGGQWYLEVNNYAPDSTNYVFQRASDLLGATGTYIRVKLAGTWQPWKGVSKGFTVTRITSGSGTYNTPAGCTRLRVRGVGAGSGGGGGNSGTGSTAGGATTFGSLTAGGGTAVSNQAWNSPPTASGGNVINSNGVPGTSGTVPATGANGFGGVGGSSPLGGGGQGGIGPGGGANAAANSGGGGGGGGVTNAVVNVASGFGGYSGAYFEHIIVAPAASYSFSIGAAGAGAAGGSNGAAGGTSGSGLVIVEEYYD